MAARHLLVVDDVCTTGKTLEFYARYFKNRRKTTTLLCVGLYHKLNPVESEHSIAWELPEAQPKSEPLPDLPTEKWGGIQADENGRTGKKNVYAGGDAVTGAATVILAMGAGKKAAAAIMEDHPA